MGYRYFNLSGSPVNFGSNFDAWEQIDLVEIAKFDVSHNEQIVNEMGVGIFGKRLYVMRVTGPLS